MLLFADAAGAGTLAAAAAVLQWLSPRWHGECAFAATIAAAFARLPAAQSWWSCVKEDELLATAAAAAERNRVGSCSRR